MCLPKRTPKAPFLLNFSSIFRGVLREFITNLSAISMPMDLDRSNQMILKRIINKWSLVENKRSDTSR
jgi:hypothetical protein